MTKQERLRDDKAKALGWNRKMRKMFKMEWRANRSGNQYRKNYAFLHTARVFCGKEYANECREAMKEGGFF